MNTMTIEEFKAMKTRGRRGGSERPRAANRRPQLGSPLERAFETQWVMVGGPLFAREYRFALGRRWRFDFAWPAQKVALEIEGGEWSKGCSQSRHTRGCGYTADCRKYNAAAVMGWRLIRATGEMIRDNPAEVMESLAVLLNVNLAYQALE